MWQTLFTLTNVVAAAAWVILIALPRKPFALALVLYGGVGLLCLAYLAMFVALFGGFADPVRDVGAPPVDYANYSVEGLKAFFYSQGGIAIGWTHYLAFDLFVGLWIARDADAKDFSRLVQAPVLFATFMAGPIGLFVWLLIRERRARAEGWKRQGKPSG